MSTPRTDPVPPDWHNDKEHRRKLANAVNLALSGKLNSHSSFTCVENVTSTTVSDMWCGVNSVIALEPKTANANADKANVWVSTRNKKSFVVTHSNLASTDRTFVYVIIG